MKTLINLMMISALSPLAAFANPSTCTAGTPGNEDFVQVVDEGKFIEFRMLELSFRAPRENARTDGNLMAFTGETVTAYSGGDALEWKIFALLDYRTTHYGWDVILTLIRKDQPWVLADNIRLTCRN